MRALKIVMDLETKLLLNTLPKSTGISKRIFIQLCPSLFRCIGNSVGEEGVHAL